MVLALKTEDRMMSQVMQTEGGNTKTKKIIFPYVSKEGQQPCQHFDFLQLRFILNFCHPVIHLDYVLIW